MFQGERDSPLHVPRLIWEIEREPRRERDQFDTNRERDSFGRERRREKQTHLREKAEGGERGTRIKDQGTRQRLTSYSQDEEQEQLRKILTHMDFHSLYLQLRPWDAFHEQVSLCFFFFLISFSVEIQMFFLFLIQIKFFIFQYFWMLSELGYLFICCFRMWVAPESNRQMISTQRHEQELQIISEDCTSKKVFKNFLCVCLFFTV